MAFISRLLGADQASAGAANVLYRVTGSASAAIVRNVRLTNMSGGNNTVNVLFRPNGGAQYQITEKNKVLAQGEKLLISHELTLAAGDGIEVSNSAAIDYVVCGLERY